jgi:uncharacterized protein involved in exopolysaccharide biosynthesis
LALVVGILTFIRPRQYVATGSFMPQNSGTNRVGDLAAQFGVAVPVTGNKAETGEFYVALVESREILKALVLQEYQSVEPPAFRGDLIEYFEIRRARRDRAIQDAVTELRKRIKVELERASGIVHFEVALPQPQIAERVAAGILERVNYHNIQLRQNQARSEREFVDRRLADQRVALQTAEDELARFYSRNRQLTRMGGASSPSLAAAEARLQRQVSINQQIYLTLAESYEQAKIDEVRNTPVISVIERPEDFVRRKPRGTVRNAVLAGFVGLLSGILLAFAREASAQARASGQPEFSAFERNFRAATRWLHRRRRQTA